MIDKSEICKIDLFKEIDGEHLDLIASSSADIRINPDEYLIYEGEEPHFFVLLSGRLAVTKLNGGHEEHLTCYDDIGTFFGEVPLLLGSASIANIKALEESRILRMEPSGFQCLIHNSPHASSAIMKVMNERVERIRQNIIETDTEQALLVGRPVDLSCHDLRQFLSGNHVNYRWLDPDEPHFDRLVQDYDIPAGTSNEQPYLRLPDGQILQNPDRLACAAAIGLPTAPKQDRYQVVIIGGGPAGLAAAVYGASEGLSTLMLEREAPGGQAGTSSRIENYLGFPSGLSGDNLSLRAIQQAKRFGAELVVARTVSDIDCKDGELKVHVSGGIEVEADTVVLATGVSWRELDVPGAEDFVGKGIYYGAARTEAQHTRGKHVFLIGGGNSAGQAAMFFADYAEQVTLIIRASEIAKGMSQYLIDQVSHKSNVKICMDCIVVEVCGAEHLDRIKVKHLPSGDVTTEETDSLFVFIGADAETAWLPDWIERDDRGYILTGTDVKNGKEWALERDPYLLETSAPGVFAAGDVRHDSVKRVAAGVGEGSMSIAFIHQFLAQKAKS